MATGTDPSDPLDLARRELSKLKDADDWDEPTGRTEVHVTLQQPPVHLPQQSQPEIQLQQATEKDGIVTVVITLVKKVPAWGATLVLLAAIVAYAAYRIAELLSRVH